MLKKFSYTFLFIILSCTNILLALGNNNIVMQYSNSHLRINDFNKLEKTYNFLLSTFPILNDVCYIDNKVDIAGRNEFKNYFSNYVLRYFALTAFIKEDNSNTISDRTTSANDVLNNLCKANKITIDNLEAKGKACSISKTDMLKPIIFYDVVNSAISSTLPEYLKLSNDQTEKILLAYNKADDIKIGYFEYKVKKNINNAYQHILKLRAARIVNHDDIQKKTRLMECKKHNFFYTSVTKQFSKELNSLLFSMSINSVSDIFEDDECFKFFKLYHYEVIGANDAFKQEIEYIFTKDVVRIYRERFYEDFFRNKYIRLDKKIFKQS